MDGFKTIHNGSYMTFSVNEKTGGGGGVMGRQVCRLTYCNCCEICLLKSYFLAKVTNVNYGNHSVNSYNLIQLKFESFPHMQL